MVKTSRKEQWNVLELSSFQLETVDAFQAQVGICMNVTPDHLDRHHTFENYANAKALRDHQERILVWMALFVDLIKESIIKR